MLTLLSALLSLACSVASAHRLVRVVAATPLDPRLLADAIRDKDRPGVRRLGQSLPSDSWEAELFSAFDAQDAAHRESRTGKLNELLLDLDWQCQYGARVPRVCASIATSGGFLFAAAGLIGSLGTTAVQDGDPAAVNGALYAALNALAVGIAGTAFCAAVHVRARRAARQRLQGAQRLVERLEMAVPVPTEGGAV